MTMGNKYIFGDIVLVNFPFAEGIGNKVRPALVLKQEGISYFLMGITSNIANKHSGDLLITKNERNNLAADSLVKINKLGCLYEKFLIKKIGNVSDLQKKEIKKLLIKYFSDL